MQQGFCTENPQPPPNYFLKQLHRDTKKRGNTDNNLPNLPANGKKKQANTTGFLQTKKAEAEEAKRRRTFLKTWFLNDKLGFITPDQIRFKESFEKKIDEFSEKIVTPADADQDTIEKVKTAADKATIGMQEEDRLLIIGGALKMLKGEVQALDTDIFWQQLHSDFHITNDRKQSFCLQKLSQLSQLEKKSEIYQRKKDELLFHFDLLGFFGPGIHFANPAMHLYETANPLTEQQKLDLRIEARKSVISTISAPENRVLEKERQERLKKQKGKKAALTKHEKTMKLGSGKPEKSTNKKAPKKKNPDQNQTKTNSSSVTKKQLQNNISTSYFKNPWLYLTVGGGLSTATIMAALYFREKQKTPNTNGQLAQNTWKQMKRRIKNSGGLQFLLLASGAMTTAGAIGLIYPMFNSAKT